MHKIRLLYRCMYVQYISGSKDDGTVYSKVHEEIRYAVERKVLNLSFNMTIGMDEGKGFQCTPYMYSMK